MWTCAVRKHKAATLFREASDLSKMRSICYQTFPWQLVGRITHRNCFVCSQGEKQDINSRYPLFDHKKEGSAQRGPVSEAPSGLTSRWGWTPTWRPQWSTKSPPELLGTLGWDFFFQQPKRFQHPILIHFYKAFKKPQGTSKPLCLCLAARPLLSQGCHHECFLPSVGSGTQP